MKKLSAIMLAFVVFAVVCEATTAQKITSQFRRMRVDAMARDAIFDDDDVIVDDSDVFRDLGNYQEAVAVSANTITGYTNASSSQQSDIDADNNEFFAQGLVQTSAVEDGASRNFGDSLFRFDFALDSPGQLLLEDVELEAGRASINGNTQGGDQVRSDRAFVLVRVTDRSRANQRVFNKVIRLRENDEQIELRDRFDIDLDAGNYRLVVLARISGDDGFNVFQGQPRGSDAYYFVEGRIVEGSLTPVFEGIEQEVSGSFVGNDPFGDDPPFGSDVISDDTFSAFNETLDLSESSTTTIANSNSDVDPASGTFYAYGYAASGLYVQGSASSDAESFLETQFRLARSGSVSFKGIIGVSSFLGSFQAQDEPGTASVICYIIDSVTGDEIYDESVAMTGWIPGGLREVEISDTVQLPPGNYRLIIRANSSDSADNEEVGGSLAVGFYEMEGAIHGSD